MYNMFSYLHLYDIHHIRKGNIFVTQYEIMTKLLSAINTASV